MGSKSGGWVSPEAHNERALSLTFQSLSSFLGAEQDWTPRLTASTTSPTLGTGGTTEGRCVRIGNRVLGNGHILFGSASATNGSGTYIVNLPYAARLYVPTVRVTIGSGFSYDASAAGTTTFVLTVNPTAGGLEVLFMRTTSIVSANFDYTHLAPQTWANNDQINFHFNYECEPFATFQG